MGKKKRGRRNTAKEGKDQALKPAVISLENNLGGQERDPRPNQCCSEKKKVNRMAFLLGGKKGGKEKGGGPFSSIEGKWGRKGSP